MKGYSHFILGISFFIVLVTALSAEFFFSKEVIMESMLFSFAETGVKASPVDQLFIARMMRRDAWEWHFI